MYSRKCCEEWINNYFRHRWFLNKFKVITELQSWECYIETSSKNKLVSIKFYSHSHNWFFKVFFYVYKILMPIDGNLFTFVNHKIKSRTMAHDKLHCNTKSNGIIKEVRNIKWSLSILCCWSWQNAFLKVYF